MKAIIIIPARLGSTRLPEKLLLNRTGKTILEHTIKQTLKSKLASSVCVVSSDKELLNIARQAGCQDIHLTTEPPIIHNGTARIAIAAIAFPDADVFINVQADEPEVRPEDIDKLITAMQENQNSNVRTLCCPLRSGTETNDRNVVKALVADSGRIIDFQRDIWTDHRWAKHIGVYAFTPTALKAAAQTPEPFDLEQWGWMEKGLRIDAINVEWMPNGINTEDDYDAFVERNTCSAASLPTI